MANINKIRLSGTTYNIEDENASKTVELTQAQYDALETKDPNTYYVITDATAVDLANYYDKTETDDLLDAKADTATTYTKTEIDTALAAKADTATTYTKTEVDTALATKQATLVSGTNIKTINNESILGEGNITIQGGGGATYTAGTNIDITNDTINCTLPITTGTNVLTIDAKQIKIGTQTTGQTNGFSFAMGDGAKATQYYTFAVGTSVEAKGYCSQSFGQGVFSENQHQFSTGKYNVSNTGSTDADKTLFSVGNGTSSARHNAFEIRQNGDIYVNDGTNDIRLQDTILALGGLKLVKISQADYDVLATKDNNTLYIITDADSGGGSDWEQ